MIEPDLIFDHISTFSGIGGFDLAAEWMGWRNISSVEINPFARKVLEYYWPDAYHHDDIHTFTFDKAEHEITKRFPGWLSNRRILTGGIPCQPYSTAGKRLGKEDIRHLWPEMRRTIREFQPHYVLGENVRGLTNWNGGMVFDEVQADLEAEGYEVLPFLLPAAGVNAPHERYRIWFVAKRIIAHTDIGSACEIGRYIAKMCRLPTEKSRTENGSSLLTGNFIEAIGIAPNSNSFERSEGRLYTPKPEETERHSGTFDARRHERNTWNQFPTQYPLCDGNDGISSGLDRAAVFSGVKESKRKSTRKRWVEESLKAGGNAIVPQVAFQIFNAIEQYEKQIAQKTKKETLS